MINIAYLSLGCNIGDTWGNLQSARNTINNRVGRIQKASSVYDTAPWGKTDQPNFLNQLLCISTPLNAQKLLLEIQKIETALGRQRTEPWGQRVMDIDIIFFNNDIINEPDLQIPHPQAQNRNFVLVPMLEIAGGYKHPISKQTIRELTAICTDVSNIKKCGT